MAAAALAAAAAAAMLGVARPGAAQEPPAKAPRETATAEAATAAERLDAMERAERSRPGYRRLRSLRCSGRAELVLDVGPNAGEPVSGAFEQLDQAGDRYRYFDDFGDFVHEEGCDGEVAWQSDPESGVAILAGDDRAQALRLHRLTLGESWRELYSGAKVVGTQTIDGVACDVFELTPLQGPVERWLVDADNRVHGLDLEMPLGVHQRDMVQVRFAEPEILEGVEHYRRVAVRLPFASIVYHYDTIEPNAEIDAARFALPEPVRQALASQPAGAAPDDDIKVTTVAERDVVSIRSSVAPQDIGSMLSVALPEVMRYLGEEGVQPAGAPFSRYHAMGQKIDIEAGFPVGAPMAGKGRIRPGTLPGGKVATTLHIGKYQDLGRTYARLQAWIDEHDLETAGPQWEVYLTDPRREPDPAKWRTQVFWPVK
jgi:effector-binding domain-containing protein